MESGQDHSPESQQATMRDLCCMNKTFGPPYFPCGFVNFQELQLPAFKSHQHTNPMIQKKGQMMYQSHNYCSKVTGLNNKPDKT